MNDFKRNDRFGGKPRFQRPGGRPQGPMYSATCATCGKPCEVPFRPDGSRPIYCREHFGGKPADRSSAPAPRQFSAPVPVQPRPQAPDPRIDELIRMVQQLSVKVEQALLQSLVNKAQSGAAAAPAKKRKTAKK